MGKNGNKNHLFHIISISTPLLKTLVFLADKKSKTPVFEQTPYPFNTTNIKIVQLSILYSGVTTAFLKVNLHLNMIMREREVTHLEILHRNIKIETVMSVKETSNISNQVTLHLQVF